MSLGVLNNLSAVYAENNLNNTNNSLTNRAAAVVLRLEDQLRRRRRSRPFAGQWPPGQPDGANPIGNQCRRRRRPSAGCRWRSLAGHKPAQPGRYAGYRSLQRHPQLTQDAAANQEYQSILSEISNIGSTTTYNDDAVFNSNTNIYTGDASTVGASIDNLNIRALSSSNLGDTGGVMSYSNGQSNTFVDLSKTGTLATAGDALVNATTSLTVDYMATGVGGAVSTKDRNCYRWRHHGLR